MKNTSPGMDLYRFFDKDDRLLYVGISVSSAQRLSQHRSSQGWWRQVARMEVSHLDCERREAEQIEASVIKTERPLHNIRHNGYTPRPKMRDEPIEAVGLLKRGEVVALGMRDGRCFIGLVTYLESMFVTLALYSFFTGQFDARKIGIRVTEIDEILWGEEITPDLWDIDPLGDFQTQWIDAAAARRHGAEV